MTLDSLIAKYGRPQFIKLDVEGYEYHALMGLHAAPAVLCFEFHVAQLKETAKVLSLPYLTNARFNFILEEDTVLQFKEWVGRDELLRALQSQPDLKYGNVIARLG